VTRLIYDRRFTYPVPHGFVTTRARVFRLQTGLDVLVATELEDDENPGPSITNTIESLATAAVEAFGLDPERPALRLSRHRVSAKRRRGDFRRGHIRVAQSESDSTTVARAFACESRGVDGARSLQYDYGELMSPCILTSENAIVMDVRFRRIRLASMHTVLELVQSAMFLHVRGRVSARRSADCSILVWRIQ